MSLARLKKSQQYPKKVLVVESTVSRKEVAGLNTVYFGIAETIKEV